MDSLHYALLAVVVLLAVYAFGPFKEGFVAYDGLAYKPNLGVVSSGEGSLLVV